MTMHVRINWIREICIKCVCASQRWFQSHISEIRTILFFVWLVVYSWLHIMMMHIQMNHWHVWFIYFHESRMNHVLTHVSYGTSHSFVTVCNHSFVTVCNHRAYTYESATYMHHKCLWVTITCEWFMCVTDDSWLYTWSVPDYWFIAVYTYTLQHTATQCQTLQHTATHRNTPQHTARWGQQTSFATV